MKGAAGVLLVLLLLLPASLGFYLMIAWGWATSPVKADSSIGVMNGDRLRARPVGSPHVPT